MTSYYNCNDDSPHVSKYPLVCATTNCAKFAPIQYGTAWSYCESCYQKDQEEESDDEFKDIKPEDVYDKDELKQYNYILLKQEEEAKRREGDEERCDNKSCIGGRSWTSDNSEILDKSKMFCSVECADEWVNGQELKNKDLSDLSKIVDDEGMKKLNEWKDDNATEVSSSDDETEDKDYSYETFLLDELVRVKLIIDSNNHKLSINTKIITNLEEKIEHLENENQELKDLVYRKAEEEFLES
mgnify:CR=1 FL=1|tara:strand:+ start:616 stop:1341 length:726 start_codon:yes stop_codon:yes gene_type:complete